MSTATQADIHIPPEAVIAVKRGINLGCGRMILPREKPAHHALIPDNVYTDSIVWDNVDSVEQAGVVKVIDLFDYPWHVKAKGEWITGGKATVPDDYYDVALATHLCEHIPHAVKIHGVVTETHGGWWAWWDELGRVMKPGGVAHILVPHGLSRGGMLDPTHTRYLVPGTFGYFVPNPDAPFDYPLKYRWDAVAAPLFMFTDVAFSTAEKELGNVELESLWKMSQKYINTVSEFALSLRCSRV